MMDDYNRGTPSGDIGTFEPGGGEQAGARP